MVLVRRTAHSLSLRHGRSYMIIDTPALAGSFFFIPTFACRSKLLTLQPEIKKAGQMPGVSIIM